LGKAQVKCNDAVGAGRARDMGRQIVVLSSRAWPAPTASSHTQTDNFKDRHRISSCVFKPIWRARRALRPAYLQYCWLGDICPFSLRDAYRDV